MRADPSLMCTGCYTPPFYSPALALQSDPWLRNLGGRQATICAMQAGRRYHEAPPEVTGEVGRHAAALIYAVFESGLLGWPVSLDKVETLRVDAYQREIGQHLGLL
jgi:hypothetical protein